MVNDVGDRPVGGGLVDLVSRAGAGIGKGPGYVLLAAAQAAGLFWLAHVQPTIPWETFAWSIAAVNAGVYGGGAWKAVAEAKANGKPVA